MITCVRLLQVMECLQNYPDDVAEECEELRRLLLQPHFMVCHSSSSSLACPSSGVDYPFFYVLTVYPFFSTSPRFLDSDFLKKLKI